ncbi:MAG TPA: MbcA/ParS/Xre antitoxin family protein [Steroidobacteraceae bacterium]|jgi:DNA-binding XRE family transcriptional regulator|nr:MbcA/ParS/Xre antitoxin family protein [Steroidobacteraceae bacterium]
MARAPAISAAPTPEAVLSKAVIRAATQLELRQAQMARMLGLSAASASRLASGTWQIRADSKSWELATAFVRLFRSLSALTGGQTQAMRDWLHSGNDALGGGSPAERIVTAEGLIHVVQYLDAARGRV